MTNTEAREVLQEQIDKYGQEYDAEGIEALEMAIKALEFGLKMEQIYKILKDEEEWKITPSVAINQIRNLLSANNTFGCAED